MKRKKTAKKKTASKTSRKPAKAPRTGEIRAENVMVTDVVTVREDLAISALIREIRTRRFSGFPVVDAEDKAVGVVSQNDVLRALAYAVGAVAPAAQGPDWRKASAQLLEITDSAAGGAVSELLARPVRDVMTHGVTAVRPETRISDVCDAMVSKRVHRVLVLDASKKVAGLISATDLVKSFGKHLRKR
jgi:CBS domain-containing protein